MFTRCGARWSYNKNRFHYLFVEKLNTPKSDICLWTKSMVVFPNHKITRIAFVQLGWLFIEKNKYFVYLKTVFVFQLQNVFLSNTMYHRNTRHITASKSFIKNREQWQLDFKSEAPWISNKRNDLNYFK